MPPYTLVESKIANFAHHRRVNGQETDAYSSSWKPRRTLYTRTDCEPVLTPAYNFLKFTCNDVIAEWALPVTFGEDGLLAFLGLALAHERSNATKTVTAAREEMAKTVYRGKRNSATRIG